MRSKGSQYEIFQGIISSVLRPVRGAILCGIVDKSLPHEESLRHNYRIPYID